MNNSLDELCHELECKIKESDYNSDAGWRMFYCNRNAVKDSAICLVGLNPNVSQPNERPELFDTKRGKSAYRHESWKVGVEPGETPHQVIARQIIGKAGVGDTAAAMGGNLWPFRTKTWSGSVERILFGMRLWELIFDFHTPSIIVAYGKDTWIPMIGLLGIESPKMEEVRSGEKTRYSGGYLIFSDHLSRISKDSLDRLLDQVDGARRCKEAAPQNNPGRAGDAEINPPSTTSVCPVTNAAASDAR